MFVSFGFRISWVAIVPPWRYAVGYEAAGGGPKAKIRPVQERTTLYYFIPFPSLIIRVLNHVFYVSYMYRQPSLIIIINFPAS